MRDLTDNLGVMSRKGYKQPETQIQKRQDTRLINHPKVLTLCANCGKEKYHIPSRRKEHNFCSSHCHAVYQYKNGLKDTKKITEKAHEATRRLVVEGNHPFQRPENPVLANRALGHKNYGRTWLEERMGWALNKLGIKFESQFPVKYGLDILSRPKYYFPDFAISENCLLVECDGSYWHRDKKREHIRESRLKELGWNILRFSDKEIKDDLLGCANKVQSYLPVV